MRRTILCVGIVVLALLTFLAKQRGRQEPSYNAHALSYWVTLLGKPSPIGTNSRVLELQKATNAVDQIGIAALPYLVKWINFNPPRWKRTLSVWLYRTPFPPAKKLAGRINDPSLANGTQSAFAILGPRGVPALDDLCSLMNDTNKGQGAAILATRALPHLGANAVPPLLAALTNAHHPMFLRLEFLNALATVPNLEQSAHQVVPVVANCLNATNDQNIHTSAINILGRLKAVPEISVPALASCLKNTNSWIREYSANILGAFGPQASAAIPALTNALVDPDALFRRKIGWALYQIDPVTFSDPYVR
jgi:hypothetical protein